jgi:TRAP-type C4-dicarboxylate transport system substrate-binding protein
MKRLALLLVALLMVAAVALSAGCGGDEATPGPSDTGIATPTPEPITLKLVSSMPSDAVGGRIYQHFADLVEEYTDGRVTIDIYPGSQLFPVTEEWEAVVTGAVDMMADASYWISPNVPDVLAFYIDGLWESFEQAYAALEESELPQLLATKIEEAGPVETLVIMPTGIRLCILNTVRETDSLEDLDGLKCQSSPGSPSQPIYEYSGMAAVPLSFEETPTALMQGVIDAVHFPPFTIADFGMHEMADHALIRTSMLPTTVLLVNRDSWLSLPEDVRAIVSDEVVPEIYEFGKTNYREAEEAALQLIEQSVETMHWMTQEELDTYVEYAHAHPTIVVQMLMVDPEILDIIEGLRADE